MHPFCQLAGFGSRMNHVATRGHVYFRQFLPPISSSSSCVHEQRALRSRPASSVSGGESGESALLNFLGRYRDLEKEGVPRGAAAASAAEAAALELGPLRRLLSKLSDPQRTARTVHVGGTKGKGSTAAQLTAGLRAAGVRVGTYGSPHVQSIRERICVDGVPISDDAVGALVDEWAPRIERAAIASGETLTHFEVLTALAFLHFSEAGCSWSVLEVGLGGTRDATNVVDEGHTLLTVVTNVGEEHLDALGGSIPSIARAKAGIVKPSRPLVLGPAVGFAGESADIIRGIAGDTMSPVFDASDVWIEPRLDYRSGRGGSQGPPRQRWTVSMHAGSEGDSPRWQFPVESNCLGSFQRMNAATAIRALAVLGQAYSMDVCPIPDPDDPQRTEEFGEIVRTAMAQVNLLGRFQIVPLQGRADGAPVCVLDGAHTASAAEVLADSLAETFPGSRRTIFVVAMASDKDHEGVFAALLRQCHPSDIICCTTDIAGGLARSTPAEELKAACMRAVDSTGPRGCAPNTPSVFGDPHETIESGLRRAMAILRGDLQRRQSHGDVLGGDAEERQGARDLIVVTGSLHAVGAALTSLRSG